MSRRARWSPRLMPDMRRDLMRYTREVVAQESDMRGKVEALRALGLPLDVTTQRWLANTVDVEGRMQILADSLGVAECFWVTEAMALLALDASQDIPALTMQDRPAPVGLLGVEGGLPPLMGFTADAVGWVAGPDDALLVALLTRSRAAWPPAPGPQARYVQPVALTIIGLPMLLDERSEGTDPDLLALAAWLAACWTMMATPTVAERRALDTRTGRASTAQTPPPSEVSIVDLRPLRYVPADRDEGTGRRLKSRHLVRGHWTNQPHGPGRALRRLQWIAPYIKGPSGAPMSTAARVMVWRRG